MLVSTMFAKNCFKKLLMDSQKVFYPNPAKKFFSENTLVDTKMRDKLYKTIELEMRCCEPAILKSYEIFVKAAAENLNVTVSKILLRPKPTHKRYTVLKSIFVHKKHMVQYEVRTYYTWFYLSKLTGSTADTFLEYIQRMLPEGVALKVTKVAIEPLPDHIRNSETQPKDDSQKI